jgi:hypothetical protein
MAFFAGSGATPFNFENSALKSIDIRVQVKYTNDQGKGVVLAIIHKAAENWRMNTGAMRGRSCRTGADSVWTRRNAAGVRDSQ